MRRTVFRRKVPYREKTGNVFTKRRPRPERTRDVGWPERKLSRYLTRLLDADAG